MKMDKGTFENHLRFFDAGAVVFRENDTGSEMYLIIQGAVEIRKATGSSSNKTLTVLGKGDLFGEMSIIEKKPRSATAVATEPSKLLVLNEKLYESMLTENPDFARKMNRLLSERVRKANAIIQSLMTTNRQNQLWTGLLQYAKEQGVSTFKGSRVGVAAFVQWASEHLGLVEKDVQAILGHLLKRGFISYSAKGKEEILVEPRDGVVPQD
jgi:CRP/FNR family transcriptional regulator, cyclic AMP receptor protein